MARIGIEQFPLTDNPKDKRKLPGYYMEEVLKDNLDIMVKAIVRDMMFVGIVSGHGGVRVGKSVLTQQIGWYLTDAVNKAHNVNNSFTTDNICFDGDALISTAMKAKPYSVIVLDEGDDLTESYWSGLAKKLRRFFRKCGQLNLFILILIPDYFELPRPYAITRSNFLIDVKFEGEFERGFFKFYSAEKKRELYYRGRKFGNYNAADCSFQGRFFDFYVVDEKKYKEKKKADLTSDNVARENPELLAAKRQYIIEIYNRLPQLHKMEMKFQAELLGFLRASYYKVKRRLFELNAEYSEAEEQRLPTPDGLYSPPVDL